MIHLAGARCPRSDHGEYFSEIRRIALSFAFVENGEKDFFSRRRPSGKKSKTDAIASDLSKIDLLFLSQTTEKMGSIDKAQRSNTWEAVDFAANRCSQFFGRQRMDVSAWGKLAG